jgi:copper(I)-binding protein
MSRILLLLLSFALASTCALAADFQLKSLDIKQPFARATPPGAKAAGVFMTIQNKGTDGDRLVAASSPVAGVVQIHEMQMDGGVMKMRAIPGLDIKPGATVELKPSGYHVMLMDLKQPLKQGDSVPVTLKFEKAGTVEIKAAIGSMGADHAH